MVVVAVMVVIVVCESDSGSTFSDGGDGGGLFFPEWSLCLESITIQQSYYAIEEPLGGDGPEAGPETRN